MDVEDEVNDMGEFLLLMAKERAAKQGVTVETVRRKGKVRDEIKKAVQEYDVSLVVLGRPVDAESAFQLAGLQTFAQEIEQETGAAVILV